MQGEGRVNKMNCSLNVDTLHSEVEIEFQDSTGWIKCQGKYPSHGLCKQQNSSCQLHYLVLFLSPAQRSTSWSFSKYRHLPYAAVHTFSFKCICIKSHRIALYILTCFPGSGKPSPYYYSSPTREEPRRTQVNITILHKCLVPLHSYLLLLYTLSLVYLCRIFYTAILMYAVF